MTNSGRPSFVIFVADQLRADHLGRTSGGAVRTPAIDALAADGTVFERAYVAAPICMPNRGTIATGRWPSVHGTRMNGIPLDPHAQTFMRRLREQGWDTAAVGKLHFQTMGWTFESFQFREMSDRTPLLVDPDASDAVSARDDGRRDGHENGALHRAAFVPLPSDYYGFDHVDLVVGHGDQATGHYTHWARERGVDPDALSGFEQARVRYEGWDQVYRTEVPADLYPTSFITERAIAQLERVAHDKRPFLLFCSYPDPHHPFTPPAPYWGMYDPRDVPIPATFGDRHQQSPPHLRAIAGRRGVPPADPTMTWAPTEEQLRMATAAEFGMISQIDDSVAAILGALERLRLDERTNVIFTSDHGDLFGDHGLLLKHFAHYDGVLRVPLVMRGPEIERRTTDALVSSADLAPTVLDLADVTPYRGIQGRSLRALLENRASALRHHLVIEEDQPYGADGLPAPVRMRTLLTESARLTVYGRQDFGELYDRESDPSELQNLFATADGAALKAQMFQTLATALIELDETGVGPVAAA